MINKLIISSIIKKYYLGEIEQVKWEIKDNNLNIDFIAPSNIVMGNVSCSNFPLEDSSLAIYNTKKLSNLINITSGELLFEIEKQEQILLKLHISDTNYNLTYALSDPLLFPKPGKVKPPSTYEVILNLNVEDISNLLKAKNALADVDNMIITTIKDLDGGDICEFVFGDEAGHNNKITYRLRGEINDPNIKIRYNSDMFKLILYANKDTDEGKLQLSSEGLLKLNFKTGDIKSEYYMVPQEGGVY